MVYFAKLKNVFHKKNNSSELHFIHINIITKMKNHVNNYYPKKTKHFQNVMKYNLSFDIRFT